ncbi:MAG: PilX N-terminal domain-containing pilus assembly protein, partial [candidate division NC10 bacterium]
MLKERSASRKDAVPSHTICSQEGGFVLVLVLLLTGFLLLLGSALLTIASSERQVGSNDRSGAQALYLAEAAIERTRRLLPGFSVNDVLVNNLLLGGWINGTSTDSGTYRATVTNNVASIGGLPQDGGTAVCGSTTCDIDGLVVITGTGTFQGSLRVVRVVVEVPPILRPPAPLTLVNSTVDPLFDGYSFLVSGFDRNLDGGAGPSPARPAIALVSSEAASAVLGILTPGQQSRVLGVGATPSVAVVANAATSDTLQRVKLQLARQADRVFVNPGTISEDLRRIDGGGQVTLVTGHPSADSNRGLDTAGDVILEGSGHGSGVLVVTGELTLRGSYRFDGAVLLVGDGSRLTLEGDSMIIGSVVIANRTTSHAGRAGFAIRDRAQLHFSQETLRGAARLLSARLRTW